MGHRAGGQLGACPLSQYRLPPHWHQTLCEKHSKGFSPHIPHPISSPASPHAHAHELPGPGRL